MSRQMIPLTRLTSLNPSDRKILQAHGVNSAEEFVSLCEVRSVYEAVRLEMGWSEYQAVQILTEAKACLPRSHAVQASLSITTGMLGVCVTESGEEPVLAVPYSGDEEASVGAGPGRVDLSPEMPPVRDQGRRGTCVAFAFAAAREFEEARVGSEVDLSEQHLYFLCKQADGHPGAGTYPRVALQQLEKCGVCFEKTWPYNPDRIPGNEGQGPAPAHAARVGLKHRIESYESFGSGDLEGFKASLAGLSGPQRPVPFAVPVFPSWGNGATRLTGDIIMPFSKEQAVGGHMLAAVGYEDDTEAPGGGWIYFRNSWGTGWASESRVAPGYGRLPYAYWVRYGRSAHVIQRRSVPEMMPRRQHSRAMAVAAVFLLALIGVAVLQNVGVSNAGRDDRSRGSDIQSTSLVGAMNRLCEIVDSEKALQDRSGDLGTIIERLIEMPDVELGDDGGTSLDQD